MTDNSNNGNEKNIVVINSDATHLLNSDKVVAFEIRKHAGETVRYGYDSNFNLVSVEKETSPPSIARSSAESFVIWGHNHFIEALKQGVCTIVFTKLRDGTERTMRATLHQSFLPQPKGDDPVIGTLTVNPEYLKVWDVENDGWRTVKIDTIKTFNGREVYLAPRP